MELARCPHNPSHGPFDNSSQWKKRSTMDLVFDSIGPPTNPHLPAPAQATRQPRAWLAQAQFFLRTCPGLHPEGRACIEHFRPIAKMPVTHCLKRQSNWCDAQSPAGASPSPPPIHLPCKAHTYPLRPDSKDSS